MPIDITARTNAGVRFGSPEVLSAENPALQEAAAALGMPVAAHVAVAHRQRAKSRQGVF